MTDDEFRERQLYLAEQQALAQYLQFWHQFREGERRKSPQLPTLWGHKAFSQNEEDGILNEIFRRVGVTSRTFFEVGVGNGLQNNTLFWLKQGWKGAWIEGNPDDGNFIRQAFAGALARGDLRFQQAMVTAESINGLVAATGFSGREVDLLSIDIDGNDYYVLERLELGARVLVMEYNARFPPPVSWRMPYAPDFVWDGSDWFGASLQAICDLAARRQYTLVGCNVTGSNAFFVRNDLLADRFPLAGDIEQLFQPARYFLTPGLFNHLGGTPALSVRVDGILG